MRTRETRDDTTVSIATALGVFALVVALGSLVLWTSTSALDVSDGGTNPALLLLVGVAAASSVLYLLRARRR